MTWLQLSVVKGLFFDKGITADCGRVLFLSFPPDDTHLLAFFKWGWIDYGRPKNIGILATFPINTRDLIHVEPAVSNKCFKN